MRQGVRGVRSASTGHIVGKIRRASPPVCRNTCGATRDEAVIGIVPRMTGGPPTDADGDGQRPPGPGDRPWTHPSEVGLATRGNSARRRSSMLATGVVLGGLGLLLSGLVLGTTLEEPDVESATSEPVERIERSLATVVVERDGVRSMAGGIVLDEDGHLLVAASELEGADRVEASCGGSELSEAATVARDDGSDLAVLRMERPAGTPIAVAAHHAAAQGRVILARPTEGGTSTVAAVLSEGRNLVETAAEGAQMVFDRSGRLLGMSAEDGKVTPATELLEAARELLDSTG